MSATASNTILQEYADSRGLSLAVDRTAGIIKGVKLLGRISKKGREYPPAVIAKAAPLYDGIRVNVDHVDPGQRRSLRDRIGIIKNVAMREDGLYGDFHFNPKHVLAEQIAWDAEHVPQNLGFSHDTRGVSKSVGGKVVVESIDKVLSMDLVANPATTDGLFESSDESVTQEDDMDLSKLTLQELRESRDDLVQAVLTEAADGQKVKSLESQLKSLQETIDGYKAAEAKRLLQEAIAGELKSAGIDPANKAQCSEFFLEDLHATTDAAKRAAKIADRKSLVAATPTTSAGVPHSAAPLTESADAAAIPANSSLAQRVRSWMR